MFIQSLQKDWNPGNNDFFYNVKGGGLSALMIQIVNILFKKQNMIKTNWYIISDAGLI